MSQKNSTVPSEFILAEITHKPELQVLLLVAFLVIYGVALIGNLSLIILTKLDSHLHTPMYYFIRHLSFIDLGNSTVIYPKMMVNIAMNQNVISYYACATQMACYLVFIICELFILSSMAYDRYVAICNPLLYSVIMSERRCLALVSIPYIYSVFEAVMLTTKIFTSTFCGFNVLSHFYCDDAPMLLLLCSNARQIELMIILFCAFNLISSLFIILVSYLLIVLAIYGMHSAEGRKKAFLTCGSHLTVVVIFYVPLLFVYLKPKSTHSSETDNIASVFFTLVIPMINPMIYSFRNKEVKNAVLRLFKKRCKLCT
ncbi:olfactory receptor 8K5-like [Acomys russatus]|uniref:olfactory receptor 8K5-like n=1 Tax=Acomys russatus TaxID=60746 RepID=UPI0021E29010|nr:olfactory receptor 8K5-like [Acomys russatus]